MKKILFILFMTWSTAHAQIPNYSTTYGGYNFNDRVMVPGGFNAPAGINPVLYTKQIGRAGALFIDTTGGNKGFYYYIDGVFKRLADTSEIVTVTASQGLTRSTNDIQLGSATLNGSGISGNRYINMNGDTIFFTSGSTRLWIGSDSSIAGGAAFMEGKGAYGLQINARSDTDARTYNGMAWYKQGVLKGSFGHDAGPSTNHFFFDASDDANGFLSYNWEWGGLSHMVIYRTGMQYFAQRGAKRAHFGAATEPGQTLVVTGSQLVTDTAHFAKKMFITDSTGYDIMMSARGTPYQTKMMTVADLATLVGAGGLQDLASVLTQGGISTVNTSLQATNLTDFQFSATGDAGMTAGASLFVHATNDLNIGTNNTDGTTSHIKLRAADSIVFNQPNGVYYAYAVPHSLVATGKMLVWDSVGRGITARALPTNTALSNLASVAINTTLLPATSGAIDLGSTSFQWGNAFLKEGGVINWDNGDITVTQTGNDVVLNGGNFYVQESGTIGTANSALTAGGRMSYSSAVLTFATFGGVRMTLSTPSSFIYTSSRLVTAKGANVASANDMTLGMDGNVFTITGTTQINTIATTNWLAGAEVTLVFASTPTVKHNTAGTGAVILLNGGVDFVATANDTLKIMFDGTNWLQTGGSIN